MTNSVPAVVTDEHGGELFDAQPRGICGTATRATALEQVAKFARLTVESGDSLFTIGVGGISTAVEVEQFLEQGAQAVQVATAAMVHDDIAGRLRLAGSTS